MTKRVSVEGTRHGAGGGWWAGHSTGPVIVAHILRSTGNRYAHSAHPLWPKATRIEHEPQNRRRFSPWNFPHSYLITTRRRGIDFGCSQGERGEVSCNSSGCAAAAAHSDELRRRAAPSLALPFSKKRPTDKMKAAKSGSRSLSHSVIDNAVDYLVTLAAKLYFPCGTYSRLQRMRSIYSVNIYMDA